MFGDAGDAPCQFDFPHQSMTLDIADQSSVFQRNRDAVNNDQRYEQIQKAKFKSVEQGMDYDNFHKMVLGAHLSAINFSKTPMDEIASASAKEQKKGVLAEEYRGDGGSKESNTSILAEYNSDLGFLPVVQYDEASILANDLDVGLGSLHYQVGQEKDILKSDVFELIQKKGDASINMESNIKSFHDQDTEWRDLDTAGKVYILCKVNKTVLGQLFDVSIGFDSLKLLTIVLDELHTAIEDKLGENTKYQDLSMEVLTSTCFLLLYSIAHSPRIGLASSFLSEEEKVVFHQVKDVLYTWLEKGGNDFLRMHPLFPPVVLDPVDSDKTPIVTKKKAKSTKYPMLLNGWGDIGVDMFSGGCRDDDKTSIQDSMSSLAMPSNAMKPKKKKKTQVLVFNSEEIEKCLNLIL